MIVGLGLVMVVLLPASVNLGCSGLSLRRIGSLLQQGMLLALVALGPLVLGGCAALVSGTNTTPTLNITNVQTGSATTSSSQILWTTNIPSNSSVDYGTTAAYGNSTPVDSAMVTSHQVTLSGLAAGTTYYYQVNSTDSKNDHGKSGGHTLKTVGFSIAGTISPATGGNGATVTLSGAASTTTTADSSGNYTFIGLGNGMYTVAPSHVGFTFTPSSQSTTVNGANVTGVNFTDNAVPVAPTITAQPTSQTVTAGQTATFTVVAAGTAPLSYRWQKNGANIAGASSASYTTPVTTITDSGSTFDVVVSNTVGTVTSAAATLTVNATPTPGIQVSPASLNFGNAVVGSTLSQVLTITNTGTATLSITQVTESGSAFNVSGFSVPLNLNAGQQTTITVGFVPTSVGSASGSISIVSNASASPNSVGLSGTGIAATLTLNISPMSLNFGSITTGTSSAPQTVTITNTGNSSVTFSQISVSGAGYSITGGGTPVTLSPSQILALTALFSPTGTGSVNGSISIVSTANGSPASVSLSGTGVAPVQHSVALTWIASTSIVSGYNVYRSTVTGTGYTKLNSSLVSGLAYTDSNVQNGTTYFYVTTAVDSGGNESTYSNEAQAVIP
jgi:Transmembrane protein 131-like N-terminal